MAAVTAGLSPRARRLLCRLTALLTAALTFAALLVFWIFSRQDSRYFLPPAAGAALGLGAGLLSERLQAVARRLPRRAWGAILALGLGVYCAWLGLLASPHARVFAALWLVVAALVLLFVRTGRPESLLACLGVCAIGLVLFGYNLRGLHKDCDGRRNLVKWGHESSMAYFFPRGPRFSNPGGRLRPSLDCPMERGGGEPYVTVRYQTNRLGFRNARELPVPKPADEYRILSLGDSFATGYGVDQAAFFGPLVEAALGAGPGNRRARVWNAEVSDPAYGLHYLKTQGLRLEPDLVLYGLCVNDLFQTYLATREGSIFRLDPADGLVPNFPHVVNYGGARGPQALAPHAYPVAGNPAITGAGPGGPPPFLLGDLQAFQLVSLLRAQYARLRPTPRSTGTLVSGVYFRQEAEDQRKRLFDGAPSLGLLYTRPLPIRTEIYATFFRVLDEFRRRTEARGARFALVYFPTRHQVVPEDWAVLQARWNLRAEDFDLDLDNREILAHCAAAGIPCIDLTPAFRDASRQENLFIAQDSHPNERGHAVAAHEVARRLREIIRRSAPS